MYPYEYYKAEGKFPRQLALVKGLTKTDLDYNNQLFKLIEMLITVKGHAWCMDVKAERRKMARLMVGFFKEALNLN